MTRLSAPQLAITVSFSRLHPICNSCTLKKQDPCLQRSNVVFRQFLFTPLDVVGWLSSGCKDTHVKSSMVLECAVVADTTTPFLQI